MNDDIDPALEYAYQFITSGNDINKPINIYGDTLLHLAALYNKFNIIQLLVESGANINTINNQYLTPLHQALQYEPIDNRINNINTINYLLFHGANIDAQGESCKTPLHYATFNNNFVATKYLVEKQANINALDSLGNTPLHYAALYANCDMAKYLLDHGADKLIINTSGLNASDYARNGYFDDVVMAKFIMEYEPEKVIRRGLWFNPAD
jgi:ankyrin repeat protein